MSKEINLLFIYLAKLRLKLQMFQNTIKCQGGTIRLLTFPMLFPIRIFQKSIFTPYADNTQLKFQKALLIFFVTLKNARRINILN